MKVYLPQNWGVNVRSFLQRCGYASRIDPTNSRLSFIRRLTSDEYPRFHIYLEKELDARSYFSLHLDQKKPSYQGSRAHMAEYDGPVVEPEATRIQKLIQADHVFEPAEPVSWLDKIFHRKS